jgi:molybdopterin synthase sulfur carrier subunit
MRVIIKMFAAARDLVGSPDVNLEIHDGATVGELRSVLTEKYPAAAALIERSMLAVDARYANDEDRIDAAQEIACIPPVSGG